MRTKITLLARRIPLSLLSLLALLWLPRPAAAQGVRLGTEVQEDILANTTWTRQGSPYFIGKIGGVSVSNGARLTIEAGVTVQFDHQRSLRVESGSLQVQGTSSQPVHFTGSNTDVGWWGGIALGPNATESRIEHARFTYAGYRYAWLDKVLYAAISAIDVDITITGCVFEHNKRNAIELVGSATHILNSSFRDNGSADSQQDIQCDPESRPTIRNNTFGTGQPRAIRVPAEALPDVRENRFGGRAILVTGGRADRSTTWEPQGAPYYEIAGDITIAGPDTPTLTLPPGLDVRFQDGKGLFVGTDIEPGALIADGSWSTIRLGRVGTGIERWAGVFFDEKADTLASSLRNVDISYGGRDTVWHEQVWNANVNAFGANPLIQECEIHHSARHGIECGEASPNIRFNQFHDNGNADTHYDIMCDETSSPIIQRNTFGAGGSYALRISAEGMDKVRDNTFDSGRGVSIPGSTLTQDAEWTNQGMSHFFVTGDLLVAGSTAPLLSLAPGIELRFNSSAELHIGTDTLGGALVADGPITFTRAADIGNWVGILLDAACDIDRTLLRGITVEYGGSNLAWHEETWYGNLNIYGCSPTVQACTFRKSARHGIQMRNANPHVVNNRFQDNGLLDTHYDIYCGPEARPQVERNLFGPGASGQIYAVRLAASAVGRLRENTFAPDKGVRVLGGQIETSDRWTNQGMTQHSIQDDLVIAGEDTPVLSLDPGLTLAFDFGAGLYVGTESLPGALIADAAAGGEGTQIAASDRITLTSLSDKINWTGLFLDATCDASRTVLRGLDIIRGGHTTASWYGEVPNASVNIRQTDVTLEDCTISSSYRHGLRILDARPVIRGCAFSNNGSQDAHYDIYCDETSVPAIQSNFFGAGNAYAIKLGAHAVDALVGNDLGGNRSILVLGETLTSDCHWRHQNQDHYHVDSDLTVAGPNAPKLMIDAGNTLKFDQNVGLFIGSETDPGALVADGRGNPITMTRALENSFASWQGLYLHQTTDVENSLLAGVHLSHAGRPASEWAGTGSAWHGNLNLYKTSPSIIDCLVTDSYQNGIELEGANVTIQGCRFGNNGAAEAHSDIYVRDAASDPTLRGNRFDAGPGFAARLAIRPATRMRNNAFGGRPISIMASTLSSQGALVRQGEGHYFVEGDLHVAGAAGPVLTLPKTVTLKFDRNVGLFIGQEGKPGGLVADGPLTLTAAKPGNLYNWSGVFLGPQTLADSTILHDLIVEWAGATVGGWNGADWGGAINLDGTDVAISRCSISNSRKHGLQLRESHGPISDCTISGSGQYGAYLEDSRPSMERTRLQGNGASYGYGDLRLNQGSDAVITACDFLSESKYGIDCQDSAPTISGCTVANHDTGIYVKGPDSCPWITGCEIKDNNNGVYALSGAAPIVGGVPGKGNWIHGNSSYGIRNMGTRNCLDARYNDWGHASGPNDPSSTADDCAMMDNGGQGDKISDYVYYLGWAGATSHPPQPPLLDAPADGAYVRANPPSLRIQNSPHQGGQVTYEFQLAVASDFSAGKKRETDVPEGPGTTSWAVTNALPWDVTHYWRVRAYDGQLYSYWMEPASFTCSLATPTPSPTPTATATLTPSPTSTQSPTWTPTATATLNVVNVPLVMKG